MRCPTKFGVTNKICCALCKHDDLKYIDKASLTETQGQRLSKGSGGSGSP